ncbi:MAG: hypothetical protein ACE15C_06480 [Phycisphaerae bacterium]
MYAILKFDVEDVYYPPEYRIDDIPGWLARIMTEEGLRGTFCVTGEKARTMKDRGRNDVLEAMAAHDIFSHTQGNVRPLIPEILQDKGWDDGVEAMLAYEAKAAADIRYAFGRDPAGFSRHNCYTGAQHVAAAARLGLPYLEAIAWAGQNRQPLWYAGAFSLNTPNDPMFGGFDTIYTCDAAFEAQLAKLRPFIAECAAQNVEFVTLFGCHPVRVMAHGWLEHYTLGGGITRTPREVGWLYALKPRELEEVAKANFRRLCKAIKALDGLKLIGAVEAAKLFSTRPGTICRDELAAYGQQLDQAQEPVLHTTFSPAELVVGFAESLLYAEEHGDLPYETIRRDVLGPKTRPVTGRQADLVTHEQLVAMSRELVDHVMAEGHLPGNLRLDGLLVGLGQYAVAAGRSYAALARYEKYARLRILDTARYPAQAMRIDNWIRHCVQEHRPYGPDFTCEKLAEHARLQAWTIKPAWLHPPRGPAGGDARIWPWRPKA